LHRHPTVVIEILAFHANIVEPPILKTEPIYESMSPPAMTDASTQDHEEDLGAILTTEERVELTLLIANITEVMRKQIRDTFDASIDTGKKQQQQVLAVKNKNPNIDESKPHKETDEEEKARKLLEKREKELSAPKMLELKKDSLEFFDKWRESVISRVGTVVNNPKEVTEEQKEKASTKATQQPASDPEPEVIREPTHCSRARSI
jgi:hypothetical protein